MAKKLEVAPVKIDESLWEGTYNLREQRSVYSGKHGNYASVSGIKFEVVRDGFGWRAVRKYPQ